MVLYLVLIFIIGLFFGSFTLVIIDRLPLNKTFISGRSECSFCHHTLSPGDLIPVLSYLFLKGRCRYCKEQLPLQYLGCELLFATVYTSGVFFMYPLETSIFSTQLFLLFLLCYTVIAVCLFAIFFIDLLHGIIPFTLVIPATVAAILYHTVVFPIPFSSLLYSAVGAFLFFFIIILVTKGRGMGFGDAVFALFMGLLLGFPYTVTALYIAFLTGAFLSLILILWTRKRLKNATIPFGPFLVLGTYITLLFGNQITTYFYQLMVH